MLKLKTLLSDCGIRQVALARVVKLATPTVSQWLNHGLWPVKTDKTALMNTVLNWLHSMQIQASNDIFTNDAEHCSAQQFETPAEGNTMVLKKQVLKQETRKAFGLFKNPFDVPSRPEDLYLSPDARYVREALYMAVKHPSFMAIFGESGSGKSTLRKDLKARVQAAGDEVIFVEPYIVGMEDNDIKGKTLKISAIVDAVMAEIAPTVALPRSIDARYRQMHKHARETVKNGYKIVIIIEEAHSLPIPTLKHLKRILELESDNGFQGLFSIVLFGQTELQQKLSENNPAVREVVQRCELIYLRSLDQHVELYLEQLFKNIDRKLSDFMDDEAVEALREKLTYSKAPHHFVSNLYPLAINNTLIAALNYAANICETRITADIIKKA